MSVNDFSLRIISPSINSTIKRRRGEFLKVVVEVIPGFVCEPSDLIVEVWGAINDFHAKRKSHHVLGFVSKSEEGFIFSADIKLKHTGYFDLSFRAKLVEGVEWRWAKMSGELSLVHLWVDPEWIYDCVVYNAFIRYFGAKSLSVDGSIQPGEGGTFKDLREELKKLKKMGVNVLYLNPVHAIGELYRNYNPHDLLPAYLQPGCPYSIKDYKSIDPELSLDKTRFGAKDHPFTEFKRFVDYAHKLGMRVFMDMVFNHSAHDSVFQRIHPEWFFYKDDPWSLDQPYLYPDDLSKGKPWGDPKHTLSPNDHHVWWRDAAQLNWNNMRSFPEFITVDRAPNEPPVNPTIKEMYSYFKNVCKFWVKEFGIDGFRCDVAYRIPLDFWKECIIETREVAKNAHPKNGSVDGDVVFVAESFYVLLPELQNAGFSAVYGDFSTKLNNVRDLKGYLDYMYNSSGDFFPDGSLFFIFPECHDFNRNPDKVARDLRNHHADADLNANKSRWSITATLPGLPMIFNGFEKIEWNPASLFSYSSIDWESDKDISEYIAKINLIRRKEKALQIGRYVYVPTSNGLDSSIFSFARIFEDDLIFVCVNMDVVNAHRDVLFLNDFFNENSEFVLVDLLNKKEYKRKGVELVVVLEPGEAHIFKVKKN